MTTIPTPATAPRSSRTSATTQPTGRKLAIICSKGNLDMAYPGLILANAALGEGVETHLFFTFWGFDMITKSRMHDLKFTLLGNTATHMPQGLGGAARDDGDGDATDEEVRSPTSASPRCRSSSTRSSPRAATCGRAACRPT